MQNLATKSHDPASNPHTQFIDPFIDPFKEPFKKTYLPSPMILQVLIRTSMPLQWLRNAGFRV